MASGAPGSSEGLAENTLAALHPDLARMSQSAPDEEVAAEAVKEVDARTSTERGKLGVAPAAGQGAPKKQRKSVMAALATGDLAHVGKAIMNPGSVPLWGGAGGRAAANMKGMTFNLEDLNPDADGDGVVSHFEKVPHPHPSSTAPPQETTAANCGTPPHQHAVVLFTRARCAKGKNHSPSRCAGGV